MDVPLQTLFSFFILMYLISSVALLNNSTKNDTGVKKDTGGNFEVKLKTAYLCKGPKAKNLTHIDLYFQKKGGHRIAHLNITALSTFKFSNIKISSYMLVQRNKSMEYVPTMAYKTNRPCDEYFIRPIISLYISKTCSVPKGYNFEAVVDLNVMYKIVYGRVVTYGTYKYKFIALANEGNLACYVNEVVISPGK